MPLWVEVAAGYDAGDAVTWHPGLGHGLLDKTRAPADAVMATRMVYMVNLPADTDIDSEAPPKPPYRVPTMAEIAQTTPNGYSVVSTFTGAGGSCLGFRMAGYATLMACEFVEEARATYAANFPGVPIDPSDIRNVTAQQLTANGVPDVLEGSPPCSSFSMAGKREKGWGTTHDYSDGKKQRTEDLFWEFARLAGEIRPKVIVAENVAGLVVGTAKGYFKEIRQVLRDQGYRVEAALLDAQWLGVPQRRRRLIFIGVRDDLHDADGQPILPAFPNPWPFRYTLGDVLNGQEQMCHDTRGLHATGVIPDDHVSPTILAQVPQHYQVFTRTGTFGTTESMDISPMPLDQPSGCVMAAGIDGGSSTQTMLLDPWQADGTAVDPETGERIDLHGTALFEDWRRRQINEGSRYINSAFGEVDASVPTVTAAGGGRGTAGVMVAATPRKFTLGELRAICSFPADFILTGRYAQRWERLGRAVPPLMMRAVADTVQREILDRIA